MNRTRRNELIKKLFNWVLDCGRDDFRFRSYSGRCMYGKLCVGLTCKYPTSGLLEILEVIAQEIEEIDEMREYLELLKNHNYDSMGLDSIIYWPSIEWTPELQLLNDGCPPDESNVEHDESNVKPT